MPVPAGFVPPEGTEEGGSFDAVATLMLSGGSLVLTELDGIPVAAAEEAPEEETEMEDEDFENAVERGMV